MPPVTHAKLSPSAAGRWLNCTASVALCAQVPKKNNTFFASEGTAAHEIAERSLVERKSPYLFLGETVKVDNDIFEVTEDMVDAVSVYVLEVMKYASKKYNPTIQDSFYVEKKVNLDWLGMKGVYGTIDCVLPDTSQRTLHIFDYKHGAGEPVSATENKQLMIYALGALGQFDVNNFDFVNLHIIQPRCYDSGVSEYIISVKNLLQWAEDVLVVAVKEISENPKYVANPTVCKWCPAKHLCPELFNVYGSVSCVQEKTKDINTAVSLPDVTTMTKEQIATVIANKKLVETFMEEVSSYANARALSGETFPGLKLIQGRKGNRAWENDSLVTNAFEEKYGDKIFSKKLLTPKQMESILDYGDLEVAKQFITQSEGKIYLVPESDKGKAINVENRTETLLQELYGDKVE